MYLLCNYRLYLVKYEIVIILIVKYSLLFHSTSYSENLVSFTVKKAVYVGNLVFDIKWHLYVDVKTC